MTKENHLLAVIAKEINGQINVRMDVQTTAPTISAVLSTVLSTATLQLAEGPKSDRAPYDQGFSAAMLMFGIQQMALASILEKLVKSQPPEFGQKAAQGIFDAMNSKKQFWDDFNKQVAPTTTQQ